MYSFQFQAHPKKPCSQHNHTNAVYKLNFTQILQPNVSSTECFIFQYRGSIIITCSTSASPTQTLLGNSCVDHQYASYLFQIATRVSDQHIWWVATNLTPQNNLCFHLFQCLIQSHFGSQCSSPGKGGAQSYLTAFRTVAPKQIPQPDKETH